jgi:Terminase RNaseH-like domain
MYAIGVDLGQKRDHTAIVVVERVQRHRYLVGPDRELLVRAAERLPLGTLYPEIAQIVKHVVQVVKSRLGHQESCQLVVDATGVGKPVVDALQASQPGCWMTAVTITSGNKQHYRSGESSSINVPKQNLMAGVQLALENGELRIPKAMVSAGTLMRELLDMRMSHREVGGVRFGAERSGQHDDLVVALALAVWKAKTW